MLVTGNILLLLFLGIILNTLGIFSVMASGGPLGADTGDVNNQNQTINNQNQTINLLDSDKYTWKPYNYAKVFHNEDQLSIVVDTDSADKTFNRAYLQTQLNSTYDIIRMIYSFESIGEKNATLGLEVRDPQNNNILASWGLDKEPVNTRFPLPNNITNIPVEFRIYIITEEPGFYILTAKEFSIQ